MNVATLDIYTAQELQINTDYKKNFAFTLTGFDVMDTAYSMPIYDDSGTLVATLDQNSGIAIDDPGKKLTITFNGESWFAEKGIYKGTLESGSMDADKFYRNFIEIKVK